MKNILSILVISGIILFSVYSFLPQGQQKIKIEKIVRYFYKMGSQEAKGVTKQINLYNTLGKKTEEVNYDLYEEISDKKVFVYEEDTLLTSVTHYGSDGKIWYKKKIKYLDNGEKDLIQIYSSFTTTDTPELVAEMKFLYDEKNRICEKKYFGEINYREEELLHGITSSGGKDDSEIYERVKKRRADSVSSKYYYNAKNKIDVVYFNNDSSQVVKYKYDSNNLLISRIACYSDAEQKSKFHLGNHYVEIGDAKYYTYENKKISETKEVGSHSITIKKFNAKKNVIEAQSYDRNNNLKWKAKYKYDANDFLKEIVSYTNIEEPEYVDKFEYTYY